MSAIEAVSDIFDPTDWDDVPGFEDLTDLTYHRARAHGTVRIAFDRPDILNAFRPHTVDELLRVLEHARTTSDVGCVLLTGNGPSEKNGKWAFCTGGDQRIRAEDGYRMGAVNKVVPHAELEKVALDWARRINQKSPTAQRMLKYSFNMIDDGLVGQQLFAGETTRLAYMTDEAQEGRDQFLEKREPDWSSFPWYY